MAVVVVKVVVPYSCVGGVGGLVVIVVVVVVGVINVLMVSLIEVVIVRVSMVFFTWTKQKQERINRSHLFA